MENERYWRDEPQEEKQEVRNWKRKANRLKKNFHTGKIDGVEFEIEKGKLLNDLDEIKRKYD